MQRIGAILAGPADFPGWRAQARRLLAAGVPPEAVEWRAPGDQPGLFGTAPVPDVPATLATTTGRGGYLSESGNLLPPPGGTSSEHDNTARFPAGDPSGCRDGAHPSAGDLSECRTGASEPGRSVPVATVPRAFVDLSETAIRHRDPERFALLYRVLWRLAHGEPALMRVATDPDVARLEAMAKAVRRDAHKMHAFVRFREISTEDGPRFVSWFEPEHHILEAEAGFFVRRFASMRWSILTPRASAHWDGEALAIGPGARRSDAPPEDAQEDLWRAYYASIFNPARLKPGAMRAEMPVKYWRNLPEARLIPSLIAEAPRRAAAMVERGASAPAPRRQRNIHLPAQPVAASDVTTAMPADLFAASAADPKEALAALRAEMLALNSLPPWTAEATQMVFGEGPVGAPLLFVGEQPGDEEDIAGRPFVGPAGRLFNKALEEAGIGRTETYVTNAVKHFKFKPTGRRRLHQSPDAGDIAYYRPFLKREIDLVGPQLVVTLGATALRAMTGKPLAINKTRGEVLPVADGPPIFPTVHPSYLLRLPDPDSKAREYERFVADLRRAHREVA
ncbi:UdgX family uracil-DNA binding protein [Craurococcus roseus]|uniref:Type-4 uracil-DNA glycosylase n=1 Tax=Craurococcus roseus TaxID=77585 RepID=A0ABP3Q3J4_9PROT